MVAPSMGTHVSSFPKACVMEELEYCGPAFYVMEPKWVPTFLPSWLGVMALLGCFRLAERLICLLLVFC